MKTKTPKYVHLVLVNNRFNERVDAGIVHFHTGIRMTYLWSVLTAKEDDWYVVISPTDTKPEKGVEFKLALSDGLLTDVFGVSSTVAEAFRHTFSMKYTIKYMLYPNYWKRFGRVATLHPVDRPDYKAKRMHYNLCSHDVTSINLKKL